MRTYTCPTCGASLATSAPPGTTITCEYCSTPFTVPQPSLDQPGDSQATVVANFGRRGNPSPRPPTGPDGTPPSTPEQPPDPDSPAGVGYTVDSDAVQPMVERGLESPEPEPAAPEPAPEPAAEPELRAPEVIEDLDAPGTVAEPVPEVPPVADLREPESAFQAPPPTAWDERVEAPPPDKPAPPVVAEPGPPEVLPMPEGVSAADIIAEPTKYGAAVPAEQGEAILVAPDKVVVVPPQNPAIGGPPGAAMRSGNRTPLLIGGIVVALCCVLGICAVAVSTILPLVSNLGGS
jgi:hypothetical protein